jgi:hypothetical protein
MRPKHFLIALALSAVVVGCKSASADSDTTATATRGSAAPAAASTDASKPASQNSLVGKWNVLLKDSSGTSTYEVTDDTITVTDVKKDGNGKALTMTSVQKYKLDGDKLTSEIQSISFQSEDPDTDKEFKAGQPKIDDQIKSGKMNYTGTIAFADKDNAQLETVDGGGEKQSLTLKRAS